MEAHRDALQRWRDAAALEHDAPHAIDDAVAARAREPPLGERLEELPGEAFDVICQAGGRSARAVQALEARGYDATNVEGGTGAWIAEGRPVEQ